MANNMESRSQHSSGREPATLEPTSLDLQFPSVPVDDKIRRWVHDTSNSTGVSASTTPTLSRKSSYETMSAPSEAHSEEINSTAGSSYEFIDTDEESRDGNATESIASTDFGRPDEVTSLADTEDSGDESGQSEGDDGSSSFQEIGRPSDGSSNVSPKRRSSTIKQREVHDRLVLQSIEFEEPFTLGGDTVSVKHTVADYSEEQTASIVKDMGLKNTPNRLAVTIRQTMTKQGLSTREPLRILYVGSHAAKQDIIHKIASSVTASVDSGNRGKQTRQYPSQLYNVVPVSAFGSEKTPEIELMHSSGYQIKVEDGISARNLKFEDSPDKPDVIKLTLDDNFSYHSVPEEQGYIVEPAWDLPHVAIFYCSANDDSEAKKTMTSARKFMGRHAVPSIVISHKQLFDRGQCMSLDHHAIHMCLESRDPNARWNIIHRRLPIDLASFLNIDARQMNRNLAYITGLHESLDTPTPLGSVAQSQDLEKTPHNMSSSFNFIRQRTGAEWRAFVPVGVFLISVLAAVFSGLPSYKFHSTPAISINSKVMSAVPISTPSLPTAWSMPKVESTPPSILMKTSTRTVTVTESPSLQSSSLSVLPSKELGDLTHPAHGSSRLPNMPSICSAQTLGDREILIRIPSATKLSWLTKEAMSVNITRRNVTVDTERAYSSDEGIILLLPKKQAYGVLNISIITTKKPRVNETFQVDFGNTMSQTLQGMMDKMSSRFAPEDAIRANVLAYNKVMSVFNKVFVEDSATAVIQAYDNVLSAMNNVVGATQARSQSTLARMEEVKKDVMEHIASTGACAARAAEVISHGTSDRLALLSDEISDQCTVTLHKLLKKMDDLERWRIPVEDRLLKAQVQSKLLWLKLRGNDKEYREYQQRATDAAHVQQLLRVMKEKRDKQLRAAHEGRRQRIFLSTGMGWD